jgi:hypothetical protein
VIWRAEDPSSVNGSLSSSELRSGERDGERGRRTRERRTHHRLESQFCALDVYQKTACCEGFSYDDSSLGVPLVAVEVCWSDEAKE